MKQYAFYVDSASCSGCKTCQAACKDKNGLEVGRLWRRVYEISGGDWLQIGAAWVSNVYAYNLSISCNHCERPICMEVCPAGAITKRADGIVLINPANCIGCRYCSWACPYGAPQYDQSLGKMSKCDFCVDRIDAGLAPVCVDACPMRALEFGERSELEAKYGRQNEVYPLPSAALTLPALIITPHPSARYAQDEPNGVANREEV